MKHSIATLALFLFFTIANVIVNRFDDSSFDDSSVFFSSLEQESLDDLFNFSTAEESIASVPENSCQSDSDIDNDFFSSYIARVRPRGDHEKCLPPLSPNIINLYDSTEILDQLSGTVSPAGNPAGSDYPPATEERNSIFPGVITDTAGQAQEDDCPYSIYGRPVFPVCSSGNDLRDNLRYPNELYYTLYNIDYCMILPQTQTLSWFMTQLLIHLM